MKDPTRAAAQRGSGSRQRPANSCALTLATLNRHGRTRSSDSFPNLTSVSVNWKLQNQQLQEAQRQLTAYRDRYIDLYDFAPLGYVTLDEDGYIQEINLAGARLLGGEIAELVGYPFTDSLSPADRAALLGAQPKVLRPTSRK